MPMTTMTTEMMTTASTCLSASSLAYDVHVAQPLHLSADPRCETAHLRSLRQRDTSAEKQHEVPRQ